MTREQWKSFLKMRIEQMEKYCISGGKIVLDSKQAKDLLRVLEENSNGG